MKHIIYFLLLITLLTCSKNKSVLLPEIQNASITKITDVSPAYIFYDDTQKDSVELNRKNLIGTTNWLVNVDKRLKLWQAIPKIKFLQDKKRNAQMHKNENAKNYYTCNDTTIKDLGFIEFTNVHYKTISISDYLKNKDRTETLTIALNTISTNSFSLETTNLKQSNTNVYSNLSDVIKALNTLYNTETDLKIYLLFNNKLYFQDYITVVSELQKIKNHSILIDHNQFIY